MQAVAGVAYVLGIQMGHTQSKLCIPMTVCMAEKKHVWFHSQELENVEQRL